MPATDSIGCEIPRRDSTSSDSSECSNSPNFIPNYIIKNLENLEPRSSISEEEASSESTSEAVSSGENTEQILKVSGEFLVPDEELALKIVKQLEFYFSDENLTKDAFLLKHVRRNKEGYVSLKLVSSFKKIRCLTKDWRVVLFSVKNSNMLSVNAEEKKLRRNVPFVTVDEPTKQKIVERNGNKTVIATNLPNDRQTIESVAELFSQCGGVSSVRILKPGIALPTDLKSVLNKKVTLGSTICAVIEFVKADDANNAVAKLGSKDNDWRSMHVFLLQKQAKNNNNSKDKKAQCSNENRQPKKNKCQKVGVLENDSGACGEPLSLASYRRKHQTSLCEMRRRGSSFTFSDDSNDSPRDSPHVSPALQRRPKAYSISEPVQPSPWVQRRMQAAKNAGISSGSSNNGRRVDGCNIPEGVVRLPRGPDGTRGFHMGAFQNNVMVFVN